MKLEIIDDDGDEAIVEVKFWSFFKLHFLSTLLFWVIFSMSLVLIWLFVFALFFTIGFIDGLTY